MCYAFWFPGGRADHVISSTYKLTSLVEREHMLLEHLSQIATIASAPHALKASLEQTAKLNKTIEWMRRRHAPLEGDPELLHHPVAAFRFIRRLASDWDHVTKPTSTAPGQTGMGFIENEGPRGLINHPPPSLLAKSFRSESMREVLQRKVHSKLQLNQDKFSYSTLSAEDLRFLATVALQSKYYTEAKTWEKLAMLQESASRHEKHNGYSESNQFRQSFEWNRKRAPPYMMSNQECLGERGVTSPKDGIQRQYTRLCREAAQGILPCSDRSLKCSWRYVWPYVRFQEEVISSDPEIIRFYDVISDRDIQHVKKMAESHLADSELSSNVKDTIQDVRISQTAWLQSNTATLQKLSRLVGEVTGLDSSFSEVDTPSELFQVVNYGLGGLYAPHEDSVRASRNTGSETLRHLKNAGDRMATWMFYLSDVRLGGATVFPSLNISVTPIKGSAVLWYNLLRNGEPDTRMVHAGCPVVIGDKWVANKWIRERSQIFKRPCSLLPN
ncbi:hypothetical protein EGW08_021377, partial [Elysia chlorotica]